VLPASQDVDDVQALGYAGGEGVFDHDRLGYGRLRARRSAVRGRRRAPPRHVEELLDVIDDAALQPEVGQDAVERLAALLATGRDQHVWGSGRHVMRILSIGAMPANNEMPLAFEAGATRRLIASLACRQASLPSVL